MNRKDFIKQSALAAAAISLAYKTPAPKSKSSKLCFSTLGCPNWDLPTIINFAATNNYQGIEIRVIANELDLPNYPAFSTANIAATKSLLSDKNIQVANIGTSAEMHHQDKTIIEKNLDAGKRFIDLAAKLDCKYVRVFPEKLLPGNEKKQSLETIITNLATLGNYAKGSNVKVLLETHGDLVKMDDLSYVMQQTAHNNTGLIWDILNMWAITKEPPVAVYQKLRKYIFHVHVKDATFPDNKLRYVMLGKGVAPVKEAVRLLQKSNYTGFYSFEWEKLWHPEIAEPEIALAAYPAEIRKYFK